MVLEKFTMGMSRTLYVPHSRAYRPAGRRTLLGLRERPTYTEQFDKLIADLLHVADGVSLSTARGSWVAPDGTEDAELVHVLFGTTQQRREVSAILDGFTRWMLREGETGVLRLWSRKGAGGAVLYSEGIS